MAKKPKKKKQQKQYCNKFNKDFKNGPHQKKKKIQSDTKCIRMILKCITISKIFRFTFIPLILPYIHSYLRQTKAERIVIITTLREVSTQVLQAEGNDTRWQMVIQKE